jgi:predicted N-acetyltransferase YhbS
MDVFDIDISLTSEAMKGYREFNNISTYNPDYDLNITSEDGKVLAFATLWYDKKNNWAIFEPVGTASNFRRMGLGKKLIYKLCNTLYEKGCRTFFVGSDQEFYKSIGFKIDRVSDVYKFQKSGVNDENKQ